MGSISRIRNIHDDFIEAVKNGDKITNYFEHKEFYVNYQDYNGFTGDERPDLSQLLALHWACRTGNIQVLQILLKVKGVDVNMRDIALWTPLHYAAQVIIFLYEYLDSFQGRLHRYC